MTAIQAADLAHAMDMPDAAPHAGTLPPAPLRPAVSLETLARVATRIYDGDQNLTGVMSETGVVLVRGSLTLEGRLVLTGQLLVEGTLTIHGDIDCLLTNAPGIVATGDITLVGHGRLRRQAPAEEAAVAIASAQGDITLDGDMEVDGLLYAPASAATRGVVALHGLVSVQAGALGRAVEPFGRVRFHSAGGAVAAT